MNCITLVVTHKKVTIQKNIGYQPIIVGDADFDIENAVRDNSGINISEKNKNYCELTAHYWFWKNWNKPYDYIGLVHYRRYLSTRRFSKNSRYYVSEINIDSLLRNKDVILPEPYKLNRTVEEFYYIDGQGRKKDFDKVRSIIKEIYPEYMKAFNEHVKGNVGSYCNMFYMKHDDFLNYSKWLFDILFKLETIIDLSGYTLSEARIYGYLSEILLNVWVKFNQKKVRYLPMAETEKGKKSYCLSKIQYYYYNNKNGRKFRNR